ncbi:hypothetical protein [Brachybacterium paraconglomeratum]|uniref:hypothetical protein n=1 Tax=Brachybacterium paraconglomeratum TaxID=173362 RepID=UPI0022AFA291|nr:hypothetical protein [Brachybacterium paraconglomeratum]MCZ4325683.1 hypothetical protein [Brachybacterium paraconglomeratum]
MNAQDQLVHHIDTAELDGVEEIEEGDVITGVVVLVRLERAAEEGSALLMLSDVDYFSQLGLLQAGLDFARADDE